MKTFLPMISASRNPWATFRESLEALDNKRLGKQRVEAYQLWRVITGSGSKSWRKTPAAHMWRGYPDALGVYIAIACQVWGQRVSPTTGRHFANEKMAEHIQTYRLGLNAQGQQVGLTDQTDDEQERKSANDNAGKGAAKNSRSGTYVDGIRIPFWLHDRRVHDSDAAVLYRKDPKHYRQFKPQSLAYAEYVWPRDIDPAHPEQKEELDALQALDQELAAKPATTAKKKKSGSGTTKKTAKQSPSQQEDEEDADMEAASEEDVAQMSDVAAEAEDGDKPAAPQTPPRVVRKRKLLATSPSQIDTASGAAAPLTPARVTRQAAVHAATPQAPTASTKHRKLGL